MRAKLLSDVQGQRIFSIVLAKGDDVLAALQDFITQQNVRAAQFTAIGAFQNATLGYFDWERKDYTRIEVPEQVEVASLLGDVALGEKRQARPAHALRAQPARRQCQGRAFAPCHRAADIGSHTDREPRLSAKASRPGQRPRLD